VYRGVLYGSGHPWRSGPDTPGAERDRGAGPGPYGQDGTGQAGADTVPALSQRRGQRRPWRLHRNRTPGYDGASHSAARHLRAHCLRHARRRTGGSTRRGDLSGQAVLATRQGHLRPRPHGDKHAYLLAGHDPRCDLRREPGALALPRAIGREYGHHLHNGDRTGRLTADAQLRGVLGRALAPDHAGHRSRDNPHGGCHAHDALQHARGHERGLREDGEGQGCRPLACGLQARPEERYAADRDGYRVTGGTAHGGCDHHGDDLLVAGDRPVRLPVGKRKGLRFDPGCRPLRGLALRARQPARGHTLRRPRPQSEAL
ncbi:MAG: Dipeptide transport system permease protein DppB, partial [uncultured Rubrobacteraceae bacterium]